MIQTNEEWRLDEQNIQHRCISLSDHLYNKGLGLAREGRLTSAISALTQSLRFDKYNILARNLLGLCLNQTGRLGDAMGHWHVSCAQRDEDNPASDYIDSISSNTRYSDKINHSLEIYNSALDFFRGGSKDMALRRLKKCVELNPNFTDALCLLSLGYLTGNEPMKAMPYIRKALNIDASNPQALSYYAALSGVLATETHKTTRIDTMRPELIDVGGYAKPENKRNRYPEFHLSEILSFVISGLITALVFVILIMPDREERFRDDIAELNSMIAIIREAGEIALRQQAEEFAGLDGLVPGLEAEREQLAAALDLTTRELALIRGIRYFELGEIALSYEVLADLYTEGFTAEQVYLYEQVIRDLAAAMEAMESWGE